MEQQVGRRGRPPHPDILTPAEWNVLGQLRKGLTNAEIAIELGISPDGVKYHVSNMLAKLGLPDRHALAQWQPPRPGLRRRFSPKAIVAASLGFCGVAAAVVGIVAGVGTAPSVAGTGLPDIHSTLKVTTFELTATYTSDARVPLPSGGYAPVQGDGASGNITTYFHAPDSVRQESTTTTGGSGAADTERSVSVVIGADSWGWTPGSTQVTQTQGGSTDDSLAIVWASSGTSLRAVIAKRAPGRDARLVGEETVAGRPAYVIDLAARPCPQVTPDLDGPERIWLDQQTFFLLMSRQFSAADGHVTRSTEVTSIKYNVDLGKSLFEPPADAEVRVSDRPACTTPTPIATPAADGRLFEQRGCGTALVFVPMPADQDCPAPASATAVSADQDGTAKQ